MFLEAVNTYPRLAARVKERCHKRCKELGVIPNNKMKNYIYVLAGSSPELLASHNKNINASRVQKGFGPKGNGSSVCRLDTILSKNPRYAQASPEIRSTIINQLGNVCELFLMQGELTDPQWDLLKIPADIDGKSRSDKCLNQRRTVHLSNVKQIKAMVSKEDLQVRLDKELELWKMEKVEYTQLKLLYEKALKARRDQKKKKLACVPTCKKPCNHGEMLKAVNLANKHWTFDRSFRKCKYGAKCCAVGGYFHVECVDPSFVYCQFCQAEVNNPDPGKMRKKPEMKVEESEVTIDQVLGQDELMDKINTLISKTFPGYKRTPMPHTIAMNPFIDPGDVKVGEDISESEEEASEHEVPDEDENICT
jgi:hypothetical protein